MEGLASALMRSTLIFMTGAVFVAVAHQPLQYYLIMFAVCLSALMARVGAVTALPATLPQAVALAAHAPAWRVRAKRLS